MQRAAKDFFHSRKTNLFREPGRRGRWLFVLCVLLAGLLFCYGLFAAPRTPNPLILATAVWGLLMGLAELLPKERTTLAAALRLSSGAAFVSMFVIMAVTLLQWLAR